MSHENFDSPHYSRCQRCNRSNGWGGYHSTMYDESAGVFALCEGCWKELTPEQRVPFYRKVYETHHRDSYPWVLLEAAVLAGK